MVGDNKRQVDSMYRVYGERQDLSVGLSGRISCRSSYFSAARELSSDPSTLINNPVERMGLDRTTGEDFLPREKMNFIEKVLMLWRKK